MEIQEKNPLFVYGTLRVGGPSYHLLTGCYVQEKRKVVQGYKMYSCGDYPTVFPVTQGYSCIEGDIISVSPEKLAEIDKFESVESGEFQRVWNDKYKFWIYVAGDRPAQTLFLLEYGVWR